MRRLIWIYAVYKSLLFSPVAVKELSTFSSHLALICWPHMYFKYLDMSTSYHTSLKIGTSILLPVYICLKTTGLLANRVDSDQIQRFAASALGMHCLLRHINTSTLSNYNICLAV